MANRIGVAHKICRREGYSQYAKLTEGYIIGKDITGDAPCNMNINPISQLAKDVNF